MKTRGWAAIAAAMTLIAGLAGCTSGTTPDQSSGSFTTCTYNAFSTAAKQADFPPTDNVETTGTIKVTMSMDAGDVVMDFDRSGAPCAVNSFQSLAKQKYFDDTSCHRLKPGFVLQCGDPSGTGTGGPGYQFDDELTGNEKYPYGTVAMANAGPDTNGSQFFIVIGQNISIQSQFVILGQVEPDTMSVIESIAAQGIDPNDPAGIKPLADAHINTVTIS